MARSLYSEFMNYTRGAAAEAAASQAAASAAASASLEEALAGTGIDIGALDPGATFGIDLPAMYPPTPPSVASVLDDDGLEWWEVGLLLGAGALAGIGAWQIGVAIGGPIAGGGAVLIATGGLWLAQELGAVDPQVALALGVGITIGGAIAPAYLLTKKVSKAIDFMGELLSAFPEAMATTPAAAAAVQAAGPSAYSWIYGKPESPFLW